MERLPWFPDMWTVLLCQLPACYIYWHVNVSCFFSHTSHQICDQWNQSMFGPFYVCGQHWKCKVCQFDFDGSRLELWSGLRLVSNRGWRLRCDVIWCALVCLTCDGGILIRWWLCWLAFVAKRNIFVCILANASELTTTEMGILSTTTKPRRPLSLCLRGLERDWSLGNLIASDNGPDCHVYLKRHRNANNNTTFCRHVNILKKANQFLITVALKKYRAFFLGSRELYDLWFRVYRTKVAKFVKSFKYVFVYLSKNSTGR